MYNGSTFQTYYLDIEKIVNRLLSRESPEYLTDVGFEEFLAYLVEQIAWKPLEWDEGAMTMEPFICKSSLPNGFGGLHNMEQPKLRLRIPFLPHPQRSEFLKLMPSIQRSSGEPDWQFEGNTLVLEVGAVETAVTGALEEIRFWIGGRNNDIRVGNATLRERVEAVWKPKHLELQKHRSTLKALAERLKIPLHQSPDAPKPIPIAPAKAPAQRPLLKAATPEPELDRGEVVALIQFIESYARQLEVTPAVCQSASKIDPRSASNFDPLREGSECSSSLWIFN